MAKVTTAINNLTSGEWSPRAKGRFDLAKYASGASKIENFLINQVGGVSFRPGTRYVAETKSSGVARIFPFQYSADQDYVVEAGDLYFRLFTNAGDLVTLTTTTTKLLLNCNTGLDAATEFIDAGNTGHIITPVGTAQMSSFKEKFGSGSLSLDGNSDIVTAPDHANWEFGAGNFTIDLWVRLDKIDYEHSLLSNYAGGADYWTFKIDSNNKLVFTASSGGNFITTSAIPSLAVSTWYHLAVVRNGATCLMFVDGTSLAVTETAAWGTLPTPVAVLRIGSTDGASNWFDGYMDEIRVSKGTARWTAGFTAPTEEYTSDATTVLLLHCNSQDESDNHHRTEFVADTQLDTGNKKYGTGSLLFDGTGDYLKIPDSVDFDLCASDTDSWTIDFWVKHADHAGTETYICQQTSADERWLLYHVHSAGGDEGLRFILRTGASDVIDTGYGTGGEITDTAWHHVALCKVANKWGIYLDGTQVIYKSDSSTKNFENYLYIGSSGTPDNYFQGNIDDMRISKSNYFAAAPVTAKTDTIVIPTAEAEVSALGVTEVTTPYLAADLFELQMAQNNDVMYIVHPDYAPRKLSRTGATAFSLSKVSFVRGPLRDTNITATTITPSADTGDITLTASAALFDALHVDSLWRITDGIVKISAVASTTSATASVQAEPDGTAGDLNTGPAAVTDWAEGAFSDYRGWPSAVAFHEQRLYYANTDSEPQKIWGSYIATYDSFDTTATTDDYSLTFEVATEQRNEIRWLSSGNRSLTIGSIGGTFSASSSDSTEAIAPDNIVINRDTNYGVANLLPKRISSFLYYIQRDFSKLRELSYSFQIDSTVSSDMTLLAEHILKDGDSVVDLDHQQSPNDRIFCVRDDGEIAVLTRNPEQEVMGWCRFVAGTDTTTTGKFESVAVIPKSEADDQVWVVVNRTIDGTTKRFIEYFTTEDLDDDFDAVRVDSSVTLDSPITITGATTATPVVITAASHGFSNTDQIKIDNILGMTELNGNTYYVADKTDDTFELQSAVGTDLVGVGYTDYISGGEVREMVTAITGLDHLNGETVTVQADGYLPSTKTYTVAAGAITISAKAAVVHVGLPYTGTLQLLKLSDGSPTGTGQTRTRRIFKGTLRLDRSQGLSIGRTTGTVDDLNYNDETDSEALFTGDMEKVFQTTWDKADEIYIKQTKPLPANILAIILRSQTEEG